MNNASSSSIVTPADCFTVGLNGAVPADEGPGSDAVTGARGRGRGLGRGLVGSVDIVEKQP
jgi:hypothetical protein